MHSLHTRWYDELCPKISDEDWMSGPVLLTLAKRITPKLLKLTWDGYPLYFTEKHGWGYVVPGDTTPTNFNKCVGSKKFYVWLMYNL